MQIRQGALLLMAMGLATNLAGCSCQRTPDRGIQGDDSAASGRRSGCR